MDTADVRPFGSPFFVPAIPVDRLLTQHPFAPLLNQYATVLNASKHLLSTEGLLAGAPSAQAIAEPAVLVGLDHLALLALSSIGRSAATIDMFSAHHFGQAAERIANAAKARVKIVRAGSMEGLRK